MGSAAWRHAPSDGSVENGGKPWVTDPMHTERGTLAHHHQSTQALYVALLQAYPDVEVERERRHAGVLKCMHVPDSTRLPEYCILAACRCVQVLEVQWVLT